MSATVGGIVIFGVIFALQELRSFRPDHMNMTEGFRTARERNRLVLLLEIGLLSVGALLIVPVVVLFAMSTDLLNSSTLVRVAIGGFAFGVETQLTALIAYVILERPFSSGGLLPDES
jgi:hypothetical protein